MLMIVSPIHDRLVYPYLHLSCGLYAAVVAAAVVDYTAHAAENEVVSAAVESVVVMADVHNIPADDMAKSVPRLDHPQDDIEITIATGNSSLEAL